MANTYISLHYHIVFSTKHRERWIAPPIQERVWAYLGGVAREHDMVALQIGGIEDHVHVILGTSATIDVATAVKTLKATSSKWIHDTFPNHRKFAWQDGYGAFTVSKSQLRKNNAYVAGQREHHRRRTFQQEYRTLLKKHEIEYDEKYVWG